MRFHNRSIFALYGVVLVFIFALCTRSLSAIEYQIGDPLPGVTIETTTGAIFDTAAPGDGVMVILFDGPGAARTPAVCAQLRQAMVNPALSGTETRLLYVRARSDNEHLTPEHVISITPEIIAVDDSGGVVFESFNVIVLPTIIVANKNSEIIYASAGITPRFGIVVEGALLFGAEKIDREEFERILRPEPDDDEGAHQRERARRIARMASKMASRGMADHAHKMYTEAIEIDPECIPALVGCGNIALSKGELDEAERLFDEAVAVDPLSVEAVTGLAQIYLQQGDDHLDEAESLLRRVLEHTPEIASVHDLLGQIHLRRGEPEKAKASFLRRDEIRAQEDH